MPWFYVRDNSILGPVTATEIKNLTQHGDVSTETLVWREGMSNWIPWGTLPSELTEGVSVEQIFERDLTTPVGPLSAAAWDWFQGEPWPLLLQVTLAAVLFSAAYALGIGFSLLIPVVGSLAGFLVLGPLQTGILLMLLERHRGQALSLKTIFRAFGPRYPQLILGQAVQAAILLAVGLPALVGFAALLGMVFVLQIDPSLMPLWMSPGLSIVVVLTGAVLSLAGMSVYFYLVIAWLFAPLLILDKGLEFWPAMQLSRRVAYRHPWGFSWFLLVTSTLALFGLVLLGVGFLFTLTLSLQMLVLAYERQFAGLRWPDRPELISPTVLAGTAALNPEDPASTRLPGG